MKLSLVVTQGKAEGKVIPITLSQFIVGRDPQCHLRPASPLISKRHCALLVRGGKVFVRDFDSTNGTAVNGEAVKGERELQNEDKLKVGPLVFIVRVEAAAPVSKPAAPPAKVPARNDEEAIAAMLLSLDGEPVPPENKEVGESIPTGSTVFELPALPPAGDQAEEPAARKPAAPAKKPPASADTSSAARSILDKYMKRPKS